MQSNSIKARIETESGWTEVIIDDSCGYEKFYKVAEALKDRGVNILHKVDDLDSLYWDFVYNDAKLTLHYNVYCGVSIFPTGMKNATDYDNSMAEQIGAFLFYELIQSLWYPYEGGGTIGAKGSEGGFIIYDNEHSQGARITEEKNTSVAPFAVTVGIYGLMFHTEYLGSEEECEEYVNRSKFLISRVFDLHDIPEERRSEDWEDKRHRLLCEFAGIAP